MLYIARSDAVHRSMLARDADLVPPARLSKRSWLHQGSVHGEPAMMALAHSVGRQNASEVVQAAKHRPKHPVTIH